DAGLEEGVRRYDEVTAQSGIYAGRQVKLEGAGQPSAARPYGWCEHSARRMARPNADRARLKEQLAALGWEL
ncbi:MAG: NADPH-dependent oxidoreductase, partial [Clostridia bacterium]